MCARELIVVVHMHLKLNHNMTLNKVKMLVMVSCHLILAHCVKVASIKKINNKCALGKR